MESLSSLRIINLRDKHLLHLIKDVIIVDRGTPWGNPFLMKGDSNRDEVCDKFEKYALWRLTIEPEWLEPLRGKSLACHCFPKRCHAETLIRLANADKCLACLGDREFYQTTADSCSTMKAVLAKCMLCNGTGLDLD